jgi:nucleotide-binding universal stress UspA family protein
MKHMEALGPIIVGVDGSRAAINAAVWAIDEAISRDVPLRIVHVTQIRQASIAPKVQFSLEREYAETALRQARAAIEATGRPVKVETVVLRGDVDEALAEESRDASMICVGSVGGGRTSRVLLGSTAVSLAARAHCPVAIIRTNSDAPAPIRGRIAVVVNDEPGNDAVMQTAMDEARVRGVGDLGARSAAAGNGSDFRRRTSPPRRRLDEPIPRCRRSPHRNTHRHGLVPRNH